MSLDTQDRKYISDAIEASMKDTQKYMGVLLETFQHRFDMLVELINTKPSRDEMKEIVDDVINSRVMPLINILNYNVTDHEKRIVRLELKRAK